MYQCACFCENLKLSYENTVKQIAKYLLSAHIENSRLNRSFSDFNEMRFKTNNKKELEIYVDISFAGEYNTLLSNELSSIYCRTGFVIIYIGVPLFWISKLETKIVLSTIEAEYIY